MVTVIMGPAGSGKSTQAELLAQNKGAIHVNTGDLLYYASQEESEEGKEIKHAMEKGEMVKEERVTLLVRQHLEEKKGEEVVMEGFPRTLSQAKALGIIPDKVFYLAISDDEATRRLLGRGRADDTKEIIAKRLLLYHEETEPILTYYRGLGVLKEIDGRRSISEIEKELLEKSR